jgi:uncharacterized membrane protein YoaK (UPF0700 family)
MADHGFIQQHGSKIAVALVLTFVSGLVDIVGYLAIFHFFTAHLTGATVQLGKGLVSGNWMDISAALVVVGAFVGGSITGRALIEIGSRQKFKRIASISIVLEAIALLTAVFSKTNFSAGPHWGLALLAAAMGLQTATLTGIGPLTVHTTFVTGMMNKLAQLLSHIAFRLYDSLHSGRQKKEDAPGNQDVPMAIFLFAIWVFYGAGAVIGTTSFQSWGVESLFIAVALLAVVLATDQFRPLSIKEEKEQSES